MLAAMQQLAAPSLLSGWPAGRGALVHAEFAVGVVGRVRIAGGVERGGLGLAQ